MFSKSGGRLKIKRVFHQLALLFSMDGHIARCRSSRGRASCEFQLTSQAIFEHIGHGAHMVLAGVPSALVQRLFLAPDDIFQLGVCLEGLEKLFFREGVELLQT